MRRGVERGRLMPIEKERERENWRRRNKRAFSVASNQLRLTASETAHPELLLDDAWLVKGRGESRREERGEGFFREGFDGVDFVVADDGADSATIVVRRAAARAASPTGLATLWLHTEHLVAMDKG